MSALLRYLSQPDVGMVGPVTNWAGNEAKIEVDYEALDVMDEFAAVHVESHGGRSFEPQMLAMFCVAIRKSLLDEIGLLDERFGIGMFEDDDFSRRVKETGRRIVCAEDIFIHHWGRTSFKKLDQAAYDRLFEENRKKFEDKWGTAWVAHQHRGRRKGTAAIRDGMKVST
jgi:GT2 family glycosyltransferase